MSRLPGVKVKTLTIKIEGRRYQAEIRMRENGNTPQFAGFCRTPSVKSDWSGTPRTAEEALREVLRAEDASPPEPWLIVRIGGLGGLAPGDDTTRGRLEVETERVLRAGIGTDQERHKPADRMGGWEKGPPDSADEHQRTFGHNPMDLKLEVTARTILMRETPQAHLQIRRLLAKLEEVWFAWLALTEGPDINLDELIDRGQLTAHARPDNRWSIETGLYPQEPE